MCTHVHPYSTCRAHCPRLLAKQCPGIGITNALSEECRDLRSSFLRPAEGGAHDCQPDGGIDPVRSATRLSRTAGMAACCPTRTAPGLDRNGQLPAKYGRRAYPARRHKAAGRALRMG